MWLFTLEIGAAQLCTFEEIAPKEPWEQKPYRASAKYNQGVNLLETRPSRRESFESRESSLKHRDASDF